jgi:glycerol uptake facilitator protein
MNVYVAEFVGTAILILLGNGVVANAVLKGSKGEGGGGGGAWIIITTGWGLAVAIAVYSVGWISGAHINPAVTVGLASIGEFDWSQVPGYILAQILGAAFGALLVFLAYFAHWADSDPGVKLAAFSTGPAIRKPALNVMTEVIGTAMLVFGVLAIFANEVPLADIDADTGVDLSLLFATGIGPLLVGFLVWGIGLSLGGPTGYAINPARDLGPRIMHAILPIPGKGTSDWEYSWIPVVAPIIGGVIGAWAFRLAFDGLV